MPNPPATPDVLPLMLLPGTLCDARLFAPLLERLDVAAIVHATLDGGDDAGAVAQAILATAPPRFALLGFSLGGIVALEIAARAPDRVAGLALIDSNARALASDAAPAPAGESPVAMITRLWLRYVAPRSHDDAPLRARVDAMAADAGPATLARHLAIARSRLSSLDRLAAMHMPALILAGAEDLICPAAMQHEMAERLPDAVLFFVPEAGHFAPIEAPDAVARHVAAWLGRVNAYADFMLSPTSPQEVS